MSNYTMQLRRIIEFYSQDDVGMKRKARLEKGTAIFFKDIDYPFYDEKERKGFQERFVSNFYFNEIGYETPEMFAMQLENWLDQNMPYWNQVIKNAMITYDPLTNVNYSTVTDRDKKQDVDVMGTRKDKNKRTDNDTKKYGRDYTDTKNDTKNTTSDTSSTGKNTDIGKSTNDVDTFDRELNSDTAGNDLQITANADGTGVVKYASNIKEDKGFNKGKGTTSNTIDTTNKENEKTDETGKTSTTGNIKDSEEEKRLSDVINDRTETSDKDLKETELTEEIKKGKHGVSDYADMVMKQRKTFIRIERKIYKEMKRDGLFMLLYSI